MARTGKNHEQWKELQSTEKYYVMLSSGDAVIIFQVMLSSNSKSKPGLDTSGSHEKHHQLSGDSGDDSLLGSSDNFLGVFMTPISISVCCETGPGKCKTQVERFNRFQVDRSPG